VVLGFGQPHLHEYLSKGSTSTPLLPHRKCNGNCFLYGLNTPNICQVFKGKKKKTTYKIMIFLFLQFSNVFSPVHKMALMRKQVTGIASLEV